MSDIYKIVRKNIRRLRLEKGFTQESLAEAANLHRAYIGHVERGRRRPGLDILYKISKALKVKITDLLDGLDD